MWLVNCNTLKLENFIGSKVPAYAILSHTWEEDEVKFQELDGLYSGSHPTMLPRQDVYDTTPKGYHKIYETCLLALKRGIRYAWIDTCCINKESSADLTESINSMFKWYQNAAECYVFLSDLPVGMSVRENLSACRWFTRGWTLQELIAPKEVLFYDNMWNYIGTRKDFLYRISYITNINEDALLGASPETFSVATRMSWAARRETTRIEDIAYCLLGIFQVNMPMIYGEGANAFLRLQEEIVKRSNDLTIFAWDKGLDEPAYGSVLALSPAAFAKSKNIMPVSRAWLDPVFAMTNKGLRF
ncbi:HET-domain-containing protein, partial [Stipitochalara longipes BDJ]